MNNNNEIKANGIALLPLLVFIGTYLGVGITLHLRGVSMAFYQFPVLTAALIGTILAFFLYKGTIDERFDAFVEGCADSNIITMAMILLLAGAFAGVSKAVGGVDSTVNLSLTLIPPRFVVPGLFIISAFISTATGTSFGTIVAVGPIAVGIASKTGIPLQYVFAAVAGGSMFGDNLSMISDTTIAATKSQGCEMNDKFKVNFLIAAPAALISIILMFIFSAPDMIPTLESYDYNIVKVLPYVFVLIIALSGVNVFITLTTGIVLSGIIGLVYGDLTLMTLAQEVANGFFNMKEIFMLVFFVGGMANMMTKSGGILFILNAIRKTIKNKKSAEIGIGMLALVTDLATANNTIAIMVTGPVAKEICEEYKVDPRRSAALLDVFSCVGQGIIPYGAQMLVLIGFANGATSAFEVIPLLWYQQLLAVIGILSIFFPFADRVINKNPWVWDKEDQAQSEKVN